VRLRSCRPPDNFTIVLPNCPGSPKEVTRSWCCSALPTQPQIPADCSALELQQLAKALGIALNGLSARRLTGPALHVQPADMRLLTPLELVPKPIDVGVASSVQFTRLQASGRELTLGGRLLSSLSQPR